MAASAAGAGYKLSDFSTVGTPLGGGSFGQVTKVVHNSTNDVFAMKAIPKKKIVEHKMTDYLRREIKTQMRLKHPNILTMYYYFEDDDNVHLLLEYARGGSLFGVLRKRGRLPEPEAARYFTHVALALDYLHQKGVIHRDLKPENILMCDGDVAKLADFGWCAEVEAAGERNTFCGTWDYLSPEMVNNEPHDHTVDVWAVGVLLYEMLTARAPFAAASQMKTLMRITGVDLQPPDYIVGDAKDLMRLLLVKEKAARLPLSRACQHPWIRQHVPADQLEEYRPEEAQAAGRDKSTIIQGGAPPERGPAKGEAIEKTAIITDRGIEEADADEQAGGISMTHMTTEQFRHARNAAIRAEAAATGTPKHQPDSARPKNQAAASSQQPNSEANASGPSTSPVTSSAGVLSASALLRSALQTEGELPSAAVGFFDALRASASNVAAGIGLGDSTPAAASEAPPTLGGAGGTQSEPVVQRRRRRHHTAGEVLSQSRSGTGSGQPSRVLSAALINLEDPIPDTLDGTSSFPTGIDDTVSSTTAKTSSRATFRTIRNKLQTRAAEKKMANFREEGGVPEEEPGQSEDPAAYLEKDTTAIGRMRTLIRDKDAANAKDGRRAATDTSPAYSDDDKFRPFDPPSRDISPSRRREGREGYDSHVREKSTPAFARRGESHEDLPASSMKRSNSESFLADAALMEKTLSTKSNASEVRRKMSEPMSPSQSESPTKRPSREAFCHKLSWELGGIMS